MGLLGPEIRPVLDHRISLGIDALPFANNIVNDTGTVAVIADGNSEFFSVPEDEIWQITWFWYHVATGTFEINHIQLFEAGGVASIPIDLTLVLDSAGHVLSSGRATPDLWLYPGDGILAVINNFAFAGDATCRFRVRKYNVVDGE